MVTSKGDGGAGRTGEKWRDNYRTPPGVIGVVEGMLGRITLDVAALKDSSVCDHYIGPDRNEEDMRDGLMADWLALSERENPSHQTAQHVAWCNPPYSEIDQWAERCAMYGQVMTTVLLCYERRETGWWRKHVHRRARLVVSLYPRVKFLDPRTGKPTQGNPNVGSCLVVWSPMIYGPPSAAVATWR